MEEKLKELQEINKQINALEKKKNKLVKKLMGSSIDLATRFQIFADNCKEIDGYITGNEKLRKMIDRFDLNRYQTIYYIDYFEEQFYFLLDPKGYEEGIKKYPESKMSDEDIKFYSECAEEMIKEGYIGCVYDW